MLTFFSWVFYILIGIGVLQLLAAGGIVLTEPNLETVMPN